jgi:S-adenosyl-L-methionine methyltransferase
MREISRLESLLTRLQAQAACLDWAFREIAGKPGIVFELGLGHGRTHDHLRRHLPDREIHVFDREVDCYPDCEPDPDRMFLGELAETLPRAAARFAGKVAFVHSDVGSYDDARNAAMSALVSNELPPALAPDALIVSDLPLSIAGSRRLQLPSGVRAERYFIYRAA